jgi:N,N'-diacetyllegionaminate synthase
MSYKKVFIIAEAGVNHNGDIILAKKLVDVAVDAQADAVKFQTFIPELVVSQNAQKADYQKKATGKEENQLDMIRKLQLSYQEFKDLQEYCTQRQILFLSTAFDMQSLRFLVEDLKIPVLKIPSGEITNLPYLKQVGKYAIEVIISTGMANMGEIEAALNVLLEAGTPKNKISILHCNTEYPTPFEDVNLKAMQTIGQAFGVKIGYSDHTEGIEVPIAAVALGAEIIEKHFTLDKTMEGPDHKASLAPNELKLMVKSIRNIEKALGNGIKTPSASEKKNTEIARRSIHIVANCPIGHIIQETDLVMKRPAGGISPMMLNVIIGKKLNKIKKADEMISFSDLIFE